MAQTKRQTQDADHGSIWRTLLLGQDRRSDGRRTRRELQDRFVLSFLEFSSLILPSAVVAGSGHWLAEENPESFTEQVVKHIKDVDGK
jgi:hypothetical protein